jgi:hypothetical protein
MVKKDPKIVAKNRFVFAEIWGFSRLNLDDLGMDFFA